MHIKEHENRDFIWPPPPPPRKKMKKYKTSRRINLLSQPRTRRPKFEPKCWLQNYRKIQIIREDDGISRRLEQLAMSSVRYLVSTRELFRETAPACVIEQLNSNIEKSALTVYSKLANVRLLKEETPKVWTEEDWERHKEWQKTRALPKKIYQDKIIKWPTKPIDNERLNVLSKPRFIEKPSHPIDFSKPFYPVSENAKRYKITDRVMAISNALKRKQRKKFNADEPDEDDMFQPFMKDDLSYEVPKEYANIKGVGLETLAKPRPQRARGKFVKGENVTIMAGVSPNALKAKANKRTLELACPKRNYKEADKQNPFSVSPKALKPLNKYLQGKMNKLAEPRTPK